MADDDTDPFTESQKRRVVERYDYVNAHGEPLFQVRRWEPKSFTQHGWTGKGWGRNLGGARQVPFRLPAVIEAVANGETVWVAEGEKDVLALEAEGVVATCNPGGAGKWRAEFSETLRGADVRIVMDWDPKAKGMKGQKHALDVARSLEGVARSVDMVRPAKGYKDASDHLAAGRTLDDLRGINEAGISVALASAGLDGPQAPPASAKAGESTGVASRALPMALGLLTANGYGPDRVPDDPTEDYEVRCPVHDDKNPSATLRVGTDRPLVFHCHAGCSQEDFFNWLREAGMSNADLLDTIGPFPADGSSWEPVDLTNVLAGDVLVEEPTMGRRADGVRLVYAAKLHSINGEPESGKSWLALHFCAQQIEEGHHVLYVDFEDSAPSVVGRLRVLGLEDDAIGGRFHYVRPDESIIGHEGRIGDLCQFHAVGLVVVDGVTEAMAVHGLSLMNNDDIAKFIKTLPRVIQRTGAAVVMIDHVTKSREDRGRFAIGGQHKLAAIDGAVYGLEAKVPFVRGAGGESLVKVDKDRPGGVRPQATRGVVGRFTMSPKADGSVYAGIQPPASEDVPRTEGERAADLRDRIERELMEHPFKFTKTRLRDRVGGKRELVAEALRELEDEGGYIAEHRPVERADGKVRKQLVWGPK